MAVAHGLSCSEANGIFQDQGSNWISYADGQADSTTETPGQPCFFFFFFLNNGQNKELVALLFSLDTNIL